MHGGISSSLKYRPEIDGLRAVAVLPVILHHAGFPWLPGGFLGVDVFFVISGYLITAIISGELREGRFSLLRFYERRARRILPTLFLVLGLCTIFAWFWLFPKEFSDFGMSLAGVATFMSNFVFWAQSGYFADAADSKPLIHTWTLAVEEQFYILFPVLLMWMASRSDKTVRATVVALLILSLMAAEIGTRAVPGITFYMLPTRAFELMIGALFALAPPSYSARARTFGHELGSLAGIALIIAGFLLLDSKSRIPGLLALIPTMGTLLVLMFAVPGTLTQHLLAGKVPVAIGLVSYSAYLWHQPLMAFARQRHLGEPPLVLMLGLGLASLALAAISWRFVEAPFRDKERVSRKTIFAISLAGIALFGTVGLLIVAKDGFPGRFDSRLHSILAVRNDWRDSDICSAQGAEAAATMQTCANKSAPVYLVGDSHANSLAKPLRALIREQGYELVSWTENACLPIAGLAMHPLKVAKSCNAYRQEVFQRIRERPGPVIFSARWRMHLTGEGFDNGEGGHESPPAEHISLPGQPSSAIPAHVARELRALAAQVPLMIVVDQIPEAGWDVPNALGRRHLWSGSSVPLSTSREAFVAQNAVVRGMINSLGSSIAVVRPDALVCDTQSQRCANERGGRPLYRDDDHPSEEFAGMIARQIARKLPERAP